METSIAQEAGSVMPRHRGETRTMDYTRRLITRIVRECPRRHPASPDELRAQQILRDEMTAFGGHAEFLPCRFNTSLYAAIALHFGLAAVAGLFYTTAPLVALGLHLLVAVSYFGDSQKHFFLLRRLLPWRRSQNLLVTFPARRKLRRRVVLLGHADAAPTGWISRRRFVRLLRKRHAERPRPRLRKPMRTALLVLLLVAVVDAWMLTAQSSPTWLTAAYLAAHGYFLIVCLLNIQVAAGRKVVDGANDNLTGCAAAAVLARRSAAFQDDDVEIVVGITAGEETGDGGSLQLARQIRDRWDRSRTVVVALECLGDGQLRVLQDGELIRQPPPDWLMAAVGRTAEARDQAVPPYEIPAGCTDVLPFLVRGYDGLCFVRIDPATGVPANYHLPTDRPDAINYRQLADTIDFVERFIQELGRVEREGTARGVEKATEAGEHPAAEPVYRRSISDEAVPE